MSGAGDLGERIGPGVLPSAVGGAGVAAAGPEEAVVAAHSLKHDDADVGLGVGRDLVVEPCRLAGVESRRAGGMAGELAGTENERAAAARRVGAAATELRGLDFGERHELYISEIRDVGVLT